MGLDGALVDSAIAITGTVNDTNLYEWFLIFVGANGRSLLQEEQIIASGYGTFNHQLITTLDPAVYTKNTTIDAVKVF